MTNTSVSTIAALLFAEETTVNFARLVGDLDAVLGRFSRVPHHLTWDCDDVAIFDLPGTRIVLGWSDAEAGDGLASLILSAGPSPVAVVAGARLANDALCLRLVERVQTRLDPCAVLWQSREGLIDAEVIDDIATHLPSRADLAQAAELAKAPQTAMAEADPAEAGAPAEASDPVTAEPEAPRAETVAAALAGAAPAARPRRRSRLVPLRPAEPAAPASAEAAANDRPHLPKARDPELARLRYALYEAAEMSRAEEAPAQATAQMRLAIHAMNATLIMVYAPFGAAVMVYSLLKGEDLRVSSRALLLGGSLSMAAHTPLALSMLAVAGT